MSVLGFGRIDSVVPLALSEGLLTFLSPKDYRVGKSIKVKLVNPEQELEGPTVSLTVGATEIREDGAYFCHGSLEISAKKWPALALALAEMGVAGACRRSSPRITSSVRVLSKELPNFYAVTRNISATGVQLQCDGPVTPGSYLNLTLETDVAGLTELVVQTVCVWCVQDPEGRVGKFRLGTALTAQHPETHAAWEEHYRRLAVKAGGSMMSRTLDGGSGGFVRPVDGGNASPRPSDSGSFRSPSPDAPTPPRPPAPTPAQSHQQPGPGQTVQGYQQAPGQGQQPPPAQAYQQPPAQAYQQPPAQAYQQPPAQAYQQPPAQAYQQPPAQAYQQPPAQAYQQPPAQAYQDPPSQSSPAARPSAQPGSPFFLPPVPPIAPSPTAEPANSFLSALPPPAATSPPARLLSPRPAEPLHMSGAQIAFRCPYYDLYQPGQEAQVLLSLPMEGRQVELPVLVRIARVENMPNGFSVCWGTVLEHETKILALNQVLPVPGPDLQSP
jgi:hypothetical protein